MKTNQVIGYAAVIGAGALAYKFFTSKKESAPSAKEAPKPKVAPSKGVVLAGDSLMEGAAQAVKTPKLTTAFRGKMLKAVPEQLAKVMPAGYDALVISGGINDLAGGAKASEIVERAVKVWQLGQKMGMRVAHLELTPTGFGKGPYKVPETERVATNEALAKAAKENGVTWLVTSTTFADPNDATQLRPEYAAPDKLHLTPKGYEAMAGIIDNWLAGDA